MNVESMPCVACLTMQPGGHLPPQMAAPYGVCFLLNVLQNHRVRLDVVVRCLCPQHKFIVDALAAVPFIPGEDNPPGGGGLAS
jgi:hypothetical protein